MEELIAYIARSIASGFGKDEIRQKLLESGHAAEDVERAFAAFSLMQGEIDGVAPLLEQESAIDVHVLKRHVPSRVVTVCLVFVIGITVLMTWHYRRVLQYDIVLQGLPQTRITLAYGSWPALREPNFFNDVKKKLILEKANFIESDLSGMVLRVYREGEIVKEADILSKGREGSWWETPVGLYQVESKEQAHFSSFGRVYQPWSMAFQGNFFIHGWPYYPGGIPVPAGYSGGCIRLSDADAKEIFELTNLGTLVLVHEENLEEDAFAYEPRVPVLQAASYFAGDLKSGFVLGEKDSEGVYPIASLAKLMTAFVATEYVNMESEIETTEPMLVETSIPRLRKGTRYSLFQLLHLLLRESSNEAAEAIAAMVGREKFISLMNEKAKAIGMRQTSFADPSGVSGENSSTAQDLFALAKYLYHNRSFLLFVSSGKLGDTAYEPVRFPNLQNFNVFSDDPDFVGGKTGKSGSAGETLLSVFETKLNGEIRPVVLILLGSANYESDGKSFYAWIKNNY